MTNTSINYDIFPECWLCKHYQYYVEPPRVSWDITWCREWLCKLHNKTCEELQEEGFELPCSQYLPSSNLKSNPRLSELIKLNRGDDI